MKRFFPKWTNDRLTRTLLSVILLSSFVLKLHHLGHLALRGLDESFHAIVAANLLLHPFTPTLIERPYVPYDYRDWQTNHIWLHKGIVPLWQIALSYLMFGVNTLALRLPSALLSTGAVLLTYLIGRELLTRVAALVAAALQAFSPPIVMLVHGYSFSDHIDVSLLFWVEMGVWLTVRAMRTGSMSDATFAGIAQGLAFLSKMYPALIVSVVAGAAWLLPLTGLVRREDSRFGLRQFICLLMATVVTAAPWIIMCAIRFPDEFSHEYLSGLRHLTHDVEGWAAPWDRLVFGYSLAAYYVFYPSVLVAGLLLLVVAWRERNLRLWLLHAWAWGVVITFALARSKTPSATAIGWPAFFLLYGGLIARAIRGDRWMLGTWLSVTVLAIFWSGNMNVIGMGGAAGQIMRQNIWVLWHVLGALVGGVAIAGILMLFRSRRFVLILTVAGAVGAAWLLCLWTERAWTATNRAANEPPFFEISPMIDSRLPMDAVLLIEEREKLERNTLMFRARRTTYAIDQDNWRDRALTVVAHGGIPVIVSHRDWPLRRLFTSERDGVAVYQLTPADLGLEAGATTQPAR